MKKVLYIIGALCYSISLIIISPLVMIAFGVALGGAWIVVSIKEVFMAVSKY